MLACLSGWLWLAHYSVFDAATGLCCRFVIFRYGFIVACYLDGVELGLYVVFDFFDLVFRLQVHPVGCATAKVDS